MDDQHLPAEPKKYQYRQPSLESMKQRAECNYQELLHYLLIDGEGETPLNREEWAARINGSWRRTVEDIFQTGRDLAAAKWALDHVDFDRMVKHDLLFHRTIGVKLMAIADDKRLCAHVHILPPYYSTLYELTKLEADGFAEAVKAGVIHPGMKRKDALKLLPRQRDEVEVEQEAIPEPPSPITMISDDPDSDVARFDQAIKLMHAVTGHTFANPPLKYRTYKVTRSKEYKAASRSVEVMRAVSRLVDCRDTAFQLYLFADLFRRVARAKERRMGPGLQARQHYFGKNDPDAAKFGEITGKPL
jgi:hypothetical protein